MPRSVLLAGATGLVGRHVLARLLRHDAVERVVTVGRRPLPDDLRPSEADAALEDHVVDFDALEAHLDVLRVDAVVCALGTTIKQAGSKAQFETVDHDYVVALARLARAQGAAQFVVVSALGADRGSWFFYNRVKGAMEEDLRAVGYPSLTILQPSLLLGDRGETRLGEEVAKRLSFLVPSTYKPVEAEAVAQVAVDEIAAARPGTHVIVSKEIRRRARR